MAALDTSQKDPCFASGSHAVAEEVYTWCELSGWYETLGGGHAWHTILLGGPTWN